MARNEQTAEYCLLEERTVLANESDVNLQSATARMTALDSTFLFGWVTFGMLFRSKLDVESMCKGLSAALTEYPLMCGRARFDLGGLYLVPSEPLAVPVFIYDGGASAPDPLARKSEWCGIIPGANRTPGPGDPLFGANIIFFEDGSTAVGIAISHALVDGCAAYQFMARWSTLCHENQPRRPSPRGAVFYDDRCFELPESTPSTRSELIATCPWRECPLQPLASFWHRWSSTTWPPCVPLEYLISGRGIAQAKAKVISSLPAEVEWVSTLEVLVAMWFKAMLLSGAAWKSIISGILINCRQLVQHFPDATYWGNAVSTVAEFAFDIDAFEGDDWLVKGSASVHTLIRNEVRNKALGSDIAWLEAIRAAGFGGNLFVSRFNASHRGMELMVNSWASFPWMNIDFGCGEPVNEFRCGLPAFRSSITLSPRTTTDLTMEFSLKPWQAEKFREVVKSLRLPFTEITGSPIWAENKTSKLFQTEPGEA